MIIRALSGRACRWYLRVGQAAPPMTRLVSDEKGPGKAASLVKTTLVRERHLAATRSPNWGSWEWVCPIHWSESAMLFRLAVSAHAGGPPADDGRRDQPASKMTAPR